jgi:hypothetical protein
MPETPTGERRDWLDDRRNVAKVFWGVAAACAALLLADLFYDKHAKFRIEDIFGFYGIFGFVGCVFLVLAAKGLRKILKRPEHYYDR